jgi:cell division protein FtsN
MTTGLALASWYVGVRIVTADEVRPSNTIASAPLSVVPVPAPVPPPAVIPTNAENSMAEAFWYIVPPEVLYLEVATFGPGKDADLVRSLQAKGFRAQVQEQDDNTRILIGPFSTHAEIGQARRKLESVGVLAVETSN